MEQDLKAPDFLAWAGWEWPVVARGLESRQHALTYRGSGWGGRGRGRKGRGCSHPSQLRGERRADLLTWEPLQALC